MKRKNIIVTLLFLVLVVFSSGCVTSLSNDSTSNNTNKTFSNEGISFEYPGDWYESSIWFDKILNGDYDTVGSLVPPIKNGNVIVQKYTLSNLGVKSIKEDWDRTIKFMKNDNVTIIMQNKTTINGLTVYEMINSGYDPAYNGTQKMLFIETGKGQNVYIIQLFAESDSFDDYLPIFKQVVSTIQIT